MRNGTEYSRLGRGAPPQTRCSGPDVQYADCRPTLRAPDLWRTSAAAAHPLTRGGTDFFAEQAVDWSGQKNRPLL